MRRTISTLVVLLACAGTVPGVRAYLGEDPGLNLYRTVDRSSGQLEARLMEKYLNGSGNRANRLIGKACQGEWGEPANCLDGEDFSASELSAILDAYGGVGVLRGRLNPEIRSLSTETAASMLATLRGMRDALASDAREERRGMELFGSVGLFADGSIENSGYDLMYDIEQINKIIFKQAPTYSGLRNDNGRGINNVLAGNFGDGTDTEASDEEESETATGSVLWSEVSGAPSPRTGTGTATGSTVPASLCPPVGGYPSDFLTSGIIDLPAVAVAAAGTGATGTGRTVTPREPTESFVGIIGDGAELSDLDGSRDSYSCRADQIFCIEIKFATYKESFGFGGGLGGRGNSIEDILDQNLRIFDKYSGSSFAQARMTNNFFELSLKDIDLPSMGHIGTVITKKPPPILNIGKSGERTDEDVDEDDEKEFAEIFSRSFEAYGLDYGRQNDLTNPCVDYQLTLLQHLSTDNAPEKLEAKAGCKPGGSADELYPSVKAAEQKEDYYRTLGKDLNEIGRFVDTIAGNISDTIGVIKGINAIPSSK